LTGIGRDRPGQQRVRSCVQNAIKTVFRVRSCVQNAIKTVSLAFPRVPDGLAATFRA
jgi:hypothetical protein